MKKLSKTQLLVLLCIILISIITSIIIFYPKTSQDGIRLSKLSETSTSGNAYKIQIQGELAYTLNLDNAYFRTYNISNPNLPQLLDSLQLNETTHDMQIVGERAFVASRYAGLHIINIEDPMNLTKLGFFACESIEAIYIDNSIAYIGSHYEYLQILNISDDTNPVEINFPLVFENDIHGLGILDKYLLAAGSQGLFIFNITNSTNPILINQFSDIGAFSHFVLHGNYMFVPQWTQGLKVLNITNLNDIEEITASYATTTPVDIQFLGYLGFVSAEDDGIFVFDIQNPTQLILKERFTYTGKSFYSLVINNDKLYVATGTDGFEIYKITVA